MKTITIWSILFLMLFLTSYSTAGDDWTQKSPSTKPSARDNHAMAYIGNGKVLLYGGWTGSYIGSNETWVYDLATNTWEQKSTTGSPSWRWSHAMAYIGGDQVLLFGGSEHFENGVVYNYTSSCWKYDLRENTWTETAPSTRPGSRRYHDMAYIGDGKVLLVGGEKESTGNYVGETWLYETSTNNWTEKTNKGFGMFLHSLAYIGEDQVLLAGIRTSAGVVDDAYLFDLSENSWTQKFDMPAARANGDMVYIGNNKTMFFGGYDDSYYYTNTTYIYDLSSNSWSTDANTSNPSARIGHRMAGTSLDGTSYIVLFGGYMDSRNDETWTFGGGDYSLPVTLSDFSAKVVSSSVVLNWSTESEIENLGFILEKKSIEQSDWGKVADYMTDKTLAGHGTTTEAHSYSITDKSIQPGVTYTYLLSDLNYAGVEKKHTDKTATVTIPESQPGIAEGFRLGNIYPNPFNATFTIPLTLGKSLSVKITLCDLNGKVVKIIENSVKPAGEYRLSVDSSDLSSGIYVLKTTIFTINNAKKIVLIK